MKRGIVWIVLTCLMVTSLVLASCNKTTTTSTSTSTSTTTSTTTTTKTSVTTTTTSPTTSATTASGNWWDSLGTPQYGGTMTLRMKQDINQFDPDDPSGQVSILNNWIEKPIADDWTLNPSVFAYTINWRPPDYVKGDLMQSWEFTDPSTLVMHVRQRVYWQNIPPANGREFTADDIVFHYDRMFGFGGGYTKPSPYYTVSNWFQIASITATDKYTVVFKWKVSNPEFILEAQGGASHETDIENPEAVKLWGNVDDWHHAIGTGPFILNDFVPGSSATLIKNTNYWAYDERYPQNRLPYIDGIKFLIIPDDATAIAAMRTGKIDAMGAMSLTQSQQIRKTNPEILQISIPQTTANTVVPRNDKAPFNDIRVRKAMQMAIDLPGIASTYYAGTCSPNPSSLTSVYVAGWGFPYDQWPQDLKDEYAYNPTAAKQLLTAAGYPNGFNTNIVADSASDLNLFQIIKSYFAAVGINMEIRPMDSTSWVAFVKTGKKHDQMAESTGADPLGLTFEPMRQVQRFTTGYGSNWAMVSDPTVDSFLIKATAATSIDEVKQIVKDANKYVAQQHFAISLLIPMSYSFCQPWLKGYNGQNQSILGEGSSPQFCFFYSSRFWIDQNLKNSIRH